MNDGNTGYPWSQGDPLLAADLNAAIAGASSAIAAGGPFLPTAGGVMSGALSLFGNATSALHAVPLQQLTAATAGGPFLPLTTGGTVSGPTSFTNVSYNMLASGAVGDGVTDDTAKIQAFLNTLPVGAEVVLPATRQFLIDSADLTLPVGITITGQGGMALTGSTLVGPAFILNPSYRIVVNGADRLSNFKVLRKGLLASPTTAQSNAAVAAWAAEAPLYKTSAVTNSGNTLPFSNTTGVTVGMRALGNEIGAFNCTVTAVVPNTSVTFSAVAGVYPINAGSYVRFGNSVALHLAPGQGGISLDRLFIMGFNTAIVSETGRYYVDSVEADCTTAMYITRGGDAAYISKVHCAPFYGGDWAKRPGPNFLLTRADGFYLESCSSVGWITGFVLSNIGGATLSRCWSETAYDGVTVTTGFRTELWIINEVAFVNCNAGGSVGFDFQHGGGNANAIGCTTAMGAGDATSIAHYRLGPSSVGQITSAQMVAGSVIPFTVQSGVSVWNIIAPKLLNAPNPWITGAPADLANVSVFGGPAANGANNTLAITASGGLTLQGSGGTATVGGALIANQGISFGGVTVGVTDTVGSIHSDANWGCLIRGRSGGVADVALQDSAGSAPLRVKANAVALSGIVGFNGTAPINKPTGWGAATGTATRSTFVTTSVTLPTLAEHVKALIDDLIAYGLIGP